MKTGCVRAGAFAACASFVVLTLSSTEAAERSERTKAPMAKEPAVTAYSSTKSPVIPEPAATGSVSAAEQASNCMKSRKRLWVEGEGWVVRRVTTCF